MIIRFNYAWYVIVVIFVTNISFPNTDFLNSLSKEKFISLFGPEKNIKKYFCSLIKQEEKFIRISIYNLTCKDVADQLIKAKKRNVSIEIITYKDGLKCRGEQITRLWRAGIPIYVATSRLMHNKYVILSKVVWTGSGNFSENGLRLNYENFIVFKNRNLVYKYRNNFDLIKNKIKKQPSRIINIIPRGSNKVKCTVFLVNGMIKNIK